MQFLQTIQVLDLAIMGLKGIKVFGECTLEEQNEIGGKTFAGQLGLPNATVVAEVL